VSRFFFTKIITMLLLLLSFVSSATTIEVAKNLEIKEVNDKPFSEGFFSNNKSIKIPAEQLNQQTTQTIVVRYKDVFEDFELGQDRVVETEYFVIKFALDKQSVLKLKTTTINDISEAESFVSKPEVMLVSNNGVSIPLELETYADYKLKREVTKVVATLPIDVSDKPLSPKAEEKIAVAIDNDIADLDVRTETNDIDNRSQEFTEKVMDKVNTLPMLKYWWQKASAKEKADFIAFIKEH